MTIVLRLARIALPLAAAGCGGKSEFEAQGSDNRDGTVDESFYLTLAAEELRLDITPLGDDSLQPQTWTPGTQVGWGSLDVTMRAPITLNGSVEGYVSTPTGITVPGEVEAIEAYVYATVPGSIQGDAAASDPNGGDFTLTLTPSDDYTLGVVPVDARLPFQVFTEQSLQSTADSDLLDFFLEGSSAVHGFLYDHEDEPVEGALVRLVHRESGIEGPVSVADAGSYLVRGMPGVTYDLKVYGEGAIDPIPTVVIEDVTVGEDPTWLDVDLGDISNTAWSNKIVDQEGKGVEDVVVRLTSQSLDAANGSLTVETTSDNNGLFTAFILPGTWKAEYIPPIDSQLSPVEAEITATVNTVPVKDVQLPPRVPVSFTVFDSQLGPIPDCSVTIQEVGFSHNSFAAVTNDNGQVDMVVSDVPIKVTLIPPANAGRAVTHYTFLDPGGIGDQLELRRGTRFSGRVVDDDQQPLDNALVELRSETSAAFAQTRTDEDGLFSIRVDVQQLDE